LVFCRIPRVSSSFSNSETDTIDDAGITKLPNPDAKPLRIMISFDVSNKPFCASTYKIEPVVVTDTPFAFPIAV